MSHLILFDIDGTLTRTNEVDSRCYVQAMSEFLGVTIDDDWSRYRHVTDSGIARELFEQYQRPQNEVAMMQQRFIALLLNALVAEPDCCRPVEGAGIFLRCLRDTPGVVIGLATGGWTESARAKLRHAGIDASGLALASADDAESRAEIMKVCQHRAAASANVARFTSTTYVGDGLWDAEASTALGWRFLGIGAGECAKQLHVAGACAVFEDFRESGAILETLGFNS